MVRSTDGGIRRFFHSVGPAIPSSLASFETVLLAKPSLYATSVRLVHPSSIARRIIVVVNGGLDSSWSSCFFFEDRILRMRMPPLPRTIIGNPVHILPEIYVPGDRGYVDECC